MIRWTARYYTLLVFQFRWWRWFWSSPSRIRYGFGPDASRNWDLAMDRWEAREPHE